MYLVLFKGSTALFKNFRLPKITCLTETRRLNNQNLIVGGKVRVRWCESRSILINFWLPKITCLTETRRLNNSNLIHFLFEINFFFFFFNFQYRNTI